MIGLIVLIGVAVGAKFISDITKPQDLFEPEIDESESEEIDPREMFDSSKINILFFGLDKNEYRDTVINYEVYRADTIMLATIDTDDNSVDIVSIPRDTYTTIYNTSGMDRVNASFAYGSQHEEEYDGDRMEAGADYLMNTVKELMGGIPIDYYMGIEDMDVVTEIVDELGGVEIDVLHTLYADKGKDRSTVRVEKGLQVLNGKDFQYYARYRAYPEGDIERVANQQHILKSLFDQMKKTESLLKIPALFRLMSDNMITNLSFRQVSALALLGMDVEMSKLNTQTFPGNFGTLAGKSYWIVDEQNRVEMIQDLYGIDVSQRNQMPTTDRISSLSVGLGKNTIQVGEGTRLTIRASTQLGHQLSMDVNDTQYSVSNPGVIRINEDNSIVGLSAGTTTLTVRVDGVTSSVTIQVLGDPNQTDDTQPTGEDAQEDEQAPTQEESLPEEESTSEDQETTEEEPSSQADEIENEE